MLHCDGFTDLTWPQLLFCSVSLKFKSKYIGDVLSYGITQGLKTIQKFLKFSKTKGSRHPQRTQTKKWNCWKMENLDKKIDLKVIMGFRNEFLCKKCDIFPRPDVKLMRCSSCTGLLYQNCCKSQNGNPWNKCPLCRYESKDPKISTFTEESQLMNLLSGFKTHPCVNVKIRCHKEILGKFWFENLWSKLQFSKWIARKLSFSRI